MNRKHRNILKVLRKKILDDVDVYNGVLGPLISEYVLVEDDAQRIRDGRTKPERAQILLDTLTERGPYAFHAFQKALQHHYDWLSESMVMLDTSDVSLHSGSANVPPISPLTVTRQEKVEQLERALNKLKPKNYVALHGMKGFGRSSLIASTLNDNAKLVRNLFQNKVYWLKFGYERSDDEEILIQLNILYHQVINTDPLPEPSKLEPLKESLIRILKFHFSKENHRNALLILDDVCNKYIVDAFNFDCKTLVITSDISALEGRRPIVIEMNDGFTEAETLGLFAKMLKTDIHKLPPEAKRIHEECKGMPLLIAMYSAQFEEFKEDMNIRPDRWKYYLECLRKKDSSNKVIEKFLEKQEAIFDICIDRLPNELKKCYSDLVIFSEDVNIMPQTLEILWEGQDRFQVEDLMLSLCHKSLAAKQWNDGLESFIYGVHDLLLCHLRQKLTSDHLKDLHRSFIEKYNKYCGGDFSKLPKDNYSYSYIGHHLEMAELYDEFPKLYFNFDFIQAKLRHTGLSDVLIDLKKYRKYITKNYDEELVIKIVDLEQFLEEQAHILAEHRRRGCLDLIQIAINHTTEGFVTQEALRLAAQQTDSLYVLHERQNKHGGSSAKLTLPTSEEVPTVVSTARFSDNSSQILVGNRSGEIMLWDCENRTQKQFTGHPKECAITKIIVSKYGEYFVSLSSDGVMKLFAINDEESGDLVLRANRSPRQRQPHWSGFFGNKVTPDESLMTFSIEGEKILDMAFHHNDDSIAACTDCGYIQIWNIKSGAVRQRIKYIQNHCLRSIAFTTQGMLLHIMDQTNGVLVTYTVNNEEFVYVSQFNPSLQKGKIIFFQSVPDDENTLVIVTDVRIVKVKWFWKIANHTIHNYEKKEIANVIGEEVSYVCAALTHDGDHLVVADTAGFVKVWQVSGGFEPVASYKLRVNSLDTYWYEKGDHLICGSENSVIHTWHFKPENIPAPVTIPLYAAILKPSEQGDVLAIETPRQKQTTIIVKRNEQIVAETEAIQGKITHLSLFPSGEKVVYSTEDGTVTLFDVDSRTSIRALKLSQPTNFIKVINIEGDDLIVCGEHGNNLKVWKSTEVAFLIEETGHVVSLHLLDEKHIITVTRRGVIKLWKVASTEWRKIKVVLCNGSQAGVYDSCFSRHTRFLAVFTESPNMTVYQIETDDEVSPAEIALNSYMNLPFDQKPTSYEFSHNEEYLAIGLFNGDIIIIDILTRDRMYKLFFHHNTVNKLHWASSAVDVPLLLSVNSDEVAWWNVALLTHGIDI